MAEIVETDVADWACFNAVFQVRFTIRTGRPRKSITRPSVLAVLKQYLCSRSVRGISRIHLRAFSERVTNRTFCEKSTSYQRWLVDLPRRMPVSSAGDDHGVQMVFWRPSE